MRELRYDFRRLFAVKYEEVDMDEAIDLILSLPHGSAYVSAVKPEYAWSEHKEALADIADIIYRVAYPGGEVRVMRPADHIAQRNALNKARSARAKIENTQWQEAD